MNEEEFQIKKQRVIDGDGGIRNTMNIFLDYLEKEQQYEMCVVVKEAMRMYDEGDLTAFDSFTN